MHVASRKPIFGFESRWGYHLRALAYAGAFAILQGWLTLGWKPLPAGRSEKCF